MSNKTYVVKIPDIEHKAYIVDAQDLILGRLSALIATKLQGKDKAQYATNIFCGDKVIVINADKVHMTGNKMHPVYGKLYYKHTGYPGGLKKTNAHRILGGKNPENLLKNSIRRMLPKTRMGKKQLENLYVYAGSEHPHGGLKPIQWDVTAINNKNKRGNA